jgi:hypothetical protein
VKYSITGELEVLDDLAHREMVSKLFCILAAYGFKLKCETKGNEDK